MLEVWPGYGYFTANFLAVFPYTIFLGTWDADNEMGVMYLRILKKTGCSYLDCCQMTYSALLENHCDPILLPTSKYHSRYEISYDKSKGQIWLLTKYGMCGIVSLMAQLTCALSPLMVPSTCIHYNLNNSQNLVCLVCLYCFVCYLFTYQLCYVLIIGIDGFHCSLDVLHM